MVLEVDRVTAPVPAEAQGGRAPSARATARRPPGQERLSRWVKFLFGLGAMAENTQVQLIGGLLLLFYSQILKVPTQIVGLAIGISLFIDAFWDLVLAQISDNLRSVLGRRHLLMYVGAVPAGVFFACLWIPPAHLSPPQLAAWLFTFVLLFRLSNSIYMVPSGALVLELAPDYHDRTVLFGYRYWVGIVGAAAAVMMTYGVFLHPTRAHPIGQLNPEGYRPMAIFVGFLITLTSLVSTISTHSRIGSLYRPPAGGLSLRGSLAQIRGLASNRNYLLGISAGMFSSVAGASVQGLAVYFNTFMFGLPARNIMLIVGTQMLSAPIAFLVAPAAAQRWGKRNAYIILFASSLVFVHGPIVLRLLGLLAPNGSPLLLPLLLASSTLAGVLTTSSAITSTSMIADVVEENQARTGRRSEALVLFSDRVFLKVAWSLAAILPGVMLSAVRFPATAHPSAVPPGVIRELAFIYLGLALAASVASMLTWRFFDIDRSAHERNLALIAGDPTVEPVD